MKRALLLLGIAAFLIIASVTARREPETVQGYRTEEHLTRAYSTINHTGPNRTARCRLFIDGSMSCGARP
ncbi:MAG: hypothetical protein AB1529_03040 [Candidatus Micrarchaeota archaeon]